MVSLDQVKALSKIFDENSTEEELVGLINILLNALQFVEKKLDSLDPLHSTYLRCPYCRSGRNKKHGGNNSKRLVCLHCNHTYTRETGTLLHRKQFLRQIYQALHCYL